MQNPGDIYKIKEAETTAIGEMTVDQMCEWSHNRAKKLYSRVKQSPASVGRQLDIEELRALSTVVELIKPLALAAKLNSPAMLDSRERRRAMSIIAFDRDKEFEPS